MPTKKMPMGSMSMSKPKDMGKMMDTMTGTKKASKNSKTTKKK